MGDLKTVLVIFLTPTAFYLTSAVDHEHERNDIEKTNENG